jgi:hypothetical protein
VRRGSCPVACLSNPLVSFEYIRVASEYSSESTLLVSDKFLDLFVFCVSYRFTDYS